MSEKTFPGIALMVLTLGLAGCQTVKVPEPVPPVVDVTQTEAQRQAAYDKYSITTQGDVFWGMSGVQDQTKFPIGSLGPVLQTVSPEAKKTFDKAEGENFVVVLLGEIGGSCLGFTAGYSLSAGKMPPGGPYLLAGGAGALVLSALVSQGPTKDFQTAAGQFDSALKEQLKLNTQ